MPALFCETSLSDLRPKDCREEGAPAGSWLMFASSNTSTPTMGLVRAPGWLPVNGPWVSHVWGLGTSLESDSQGFEFPPRAYSLCGQGQTT